MKIDKVILENFALIRSGMGINKIELDFATNQKHRINLILGNNGTGKTALLSNLHPYAFLGNLDSRDDFDIIIPGVDGLKEITFSDKKNTYEITHRYRWKGEKESRSIASYIKKNGNELNPTGSVNAFKGIIANEFGIDTNFLKLIRLGGNVTNFVEMKSADRKIFISRLLSEIEPYLAGNKVMSKRSTELSTALKVATGKRDRLGISDISIIRTQIKEKEALRVDLQSQVEAKIKDFYTYEGSIDKAKFSTCERDLVTMGSRRKEAMRKLKTLKKPKHIHISKGDESPIDKYNAKISHYSNLKLMNVDYLAKTSAIVNGYNEEKESLTKMLEVTISEAERLSMVEYISELRGKIESLDEMFGYANGNIPKVSKEELYSDFDKITMLLDELRICQTAHYANIVVFQDLMEKYNNDISQVEKKIASEFKKTNRDISEIKLALGSKPDKKLVMFIPSECTSSDKCPYYNAITNKSSKAISKEALLLLEAYLDNLEATEEIINSYKRVKSILSSRRNVEKLNTYYELTIDNFLKALYTNNPEVFLDPELYKKAREIVEHYEDYVGYKSKLKETEMELELKLNRSRDKSKEEIEERLKVIEYELSKAEEFRESLHDEIDGYNLKIEQYKELIGDYTLSLEYRHSKQELGFEIEKLSQDILDTTIIIDKKNLYDSIKKKYSDEVSKLKFQISKVETEIQEYRTKEITYIQLSDEISSIEKRFDDVFYIKDATSHATGIPLVYIRRYCKALCSIANNIIDDLYSGDFRLLEFKVKEDSFKIPYETKGIAVKDIKDASQAEASVAKIAISFAILSQFMTKYNVVLLDEIDGPMHSVNKEKFFSALEGELDRLNCEQAFIITQSEMFNDYPVNLIVTDPEYAKYIPNNAPIIFKR